ncbi:MAG TPA: GTPase domain-containing protein [Gemmataceae bacterium]|nr:GTPase domain-containing protein [Gemmataceae bacterium]
MKRASTLTVSLAERLCRPLRIGVFGHRGVGKTTLLTMLYRECAGGRLPPLRLAAADARTAEYLSDKVLQLEAGQPLPATLGETDLRFHLYYQDRRLDLLFKDYQGEHVALGRQEPIRDFLRDCDAVWLCLDVPVADAPAACLQAQQEVEQIVEDYLVVETPGAPPRPMALVLTKADLLPDRSVMKEDVERRLGMTRHTLELHCPQHAMFAVSSLGHPIPASGAGVPPIPFVPQPMGLAEPLIWLAESLQALDEARLNYLWQLAGTNFALLERCVASFSRRYPGTSAAAGFQRRLREQRRQRRRRHSLAAAILAACALLSVWTYDAWAKQHAAQIHAQQYAERLTELRHHGADPDVDAETVWQELQRFHRDFPEHDVDGDWQSFRDTLKQRRDAERERRAESAFRELERLGDKGDLSTRTEQTDRFLRDFAGTAHESEARRLRAACLLRLDQRDLEFARAYSAAHPLNFQTRRERYQRYLERHPDGAFATAANAALQNIDADWDKHDFRAVRDHFQAHPGDVTELQYLCRSYLSVHDNGRFRDAARDLLRWTERVTQPGEYRVVLKSGSFDRKVAHFFSRGPSLSVEIEVNGIRYGPSNIVPRNYQPEWDYEFPRRIRWKLGDSVRIIVTDKYFWDRRVADISSDDNDPLAMRLLSGEVNSGKNSLTFASDFIVPAMPKIE